MPAQDFKPREIFRELVAHDVDFIVVGGVSAMLQGAPLTTFDLELVHSRAPENLNRLLAALVALGAYYRGQGDRLIPRVYLTWPPPAISFS